MSLQLAVCVSCGGWEGELAAETDKTQSQENAKKRGAYPKSAAHCVEQAVIGASQSFQNSITNWLNLCGFTIIGSCLQFSNISIWACWALAFMI